MTGQPILAAPCPVDHVHCAGEAHCLFRAAGSWASCRQVLSANDHPVTPEACEPKADSRGLAA